MVSYPGLKGGSRFETTETSLVVPRVEGGSGFKTTGFLHIFTIATKKESCD